MAFGIKKRMFPFMVSRSTRQAAFQDPMSAARTQNVDWFKEKIL